ncbi:Tryptophan synthase beta chain [compost metagenome]
MRYTYCQDAPALAAFDALAMNEGIIPALESSHAVSAAMEIASKRKKDEIVVVCLSGRGEKDAAEVARLRAK